MDIFALIAVIVVIIGGVISLRQKQPKEIISNQKVLIETYEKRLKALEDQSVADHKQHIENAKAIADLQGQIKVYKEIPLRQLADSMQKISDVNEGIAASNQEILKTLKSSAKTLAHDTETALHGTAQVAIDLKKNQE